MCNYLSHFIPKLSQVSEPLRALTESNKGFVWGKVEQEHVDQIKALISEDQLLRFYNVKKLTIILCDASTKGLGATLLQEGHPIMSVSRSLTKAEKKLCGIGVGMPCNCFCMSEDSPLYLWEAYVGGNRPQATRGDCQKVYFGCPQKVTENAFTIAAV